MVYTVYQNIKVGKEITVADVVKIAQVNYPLALQVKEVAEMAVGAAEEFARTSDLPIPSDEKLQIAINVFRRWIPYSAEVPDTAMIEAIKSFIPKINALTPERKKLQ